MEGRRLRRGATLDAKECFWKRSIRKVCLKRVPRQPDTCSQDERAAVARYVMRVLSPEKLQCDCARVVGVASWHRDGTLALSRLWLASALRMHVKHNRHRQCLLGLSPLSREAEVVRVRCLQVKRRSLESGAPQPWHSAHPARQAVNTCNVWIEIEHRG